MESLLLAYSLPKETITSIRLLYKNTEATVDPYDVDADFFVIIFFH